MGTHKNPVMNRQKAKITKLFTNTEVTVKAVEKNIDHKMTTLLPCVSPSKKIIIANYFKLKNNTYQGNPKKSLKPLFLKFWNKMKKKTVKF